MLAVLTGVGNALAASVVTALGLDPRFDLRGAYWLMAGIAGADPARMSLCSAAWLDWVVDGDLLLEVDRSEAPDHWTTGRLPLGKSEPFAPPAGSTWTTSAYRLNRGLAAWAADLTRGVTLADTPGARDLRTHFGHDTPPAVLTGAVLGSSNFWHGHRLLAWARDWVGYWTEGEGVLVASAMEDAGIALALRDLGRARRADPARLLMLRTASNYVVPRTGLTAAESIGPAKAEGFAGFEPALENAYRVGQVVVEALLRADPPAP
ncbi:purine nucleoside permease [Roseomonas sp. CCTCC AB2023176]|uniref:purine nucleoside permease n=1 Tax=Roseomonas sp. CCTCC AB2023176 TaxID=3342640 RepID=UPI0035DC51A4